MSLIFATQLAAIATSVLAVFAIVTAIYARKAFLKQSQEVSDQAKLLGVQSKQLDEQRKINAEQTPVLKLQAQELEESLAERKREAEQRERAQASLVFITQERNPTVPHGYTEPEDAEPFVTATVHNTSKQPIYKAELRWHLGHAGHGEPNPEPLGTILPGGEISRMREFPPGLDLDISGAVVRFTDANEVRWIRRPDGYLDRFKET